MTGADSREPDGLTTPAPARARTAALVVGAVAILTGLLSSWPSLASYWNWDDLHLVRPYTAAELAGTLVGDWDPDDIETAGFRPLTTLFNHVRAVLLGESLVAHRLFLLGLYGATLALMADLLRRLGASTSAVVAGAAFVLVAKNSYYHYVWVADGVHVLQLFLGVLALRSCREYVEAGRRRSLAAVLALFTAALLVREDSLAFVPVMAALIAGPRFEWANLPAMFGGTRGRRLRTGAIALGVLLPVWWLGRLAAVSSAPNVKLEVDAIGRVLDMIVWTLSLAGGADPVWPAYLALAVALAVAIRWLPAPDRRLAWLLLGSAVATCLIGNVRARANLIILPGMLYGFFLGIVIVGLARRRRLARAIAGTIAIAAAAFAMRATRLEQLDLHPMSTGQIARDWQFVSGRLGAATIPEPRRRILEPKLESLGLLRPDVDINAWRRSVLEAGRIGPQPDGGVFHAPRAFLEAAPAVVGRDP